jgi:biotin carboxyl carrier protein
MEQLDRIELLARAVEGGTALCAPDVGWYTRATELDRVLVAGEEAGVLVTLGRVRALIVPEGVSGVVRTNAPEAVHHPVGWGDELLRLAPLASAPAARAPSAAQTSKDAQLVLRSDTPGRFWHRASPGAPALVQAGDVLEEGRAVGLIEVMKTFAQVVYRARGGLPARARVTRVLAADGADVAHGEALLELEPLSEGRAR